MSSHFLDSVVSDEKSGVNLIGVPCMLIVEFLLMLMKFCVCFLSIFTSCFLAWISVFTHLEFILLNLQINIFLYVCKIFAIISLNIFSAPCSFSLLLVTPIMNVNVVNSVLHLPEVFVHSLFSLFFRLHFVDWSIIRFTNSSSCKLQSTLEPFQWISVAVIINFKSRILILFSLFILTLYVTRCLHTNIYFLRFGGFLNILIIAVLRSAKSSICILSQAVSILSSSAIFPLYVEFSCFFVCLIIKKIL